MDTIPEVINDTVTLARLVAEHGPLRLNYDGGRLPLLNGDYSIVGWLGRDLTPEDVEIANRIDDGA